MLAVSFGDNVDCSAGVLGEMSAGPFANAYTSENDSMITGSPSGSVPRTSKFIVVPATTQSSFGIIRSGRLLVHSPTNTCISRMLNPDSTQELSVVLNLQAVILMA